jgi:prepilin-type processing-associated H-X9-DG protein
MGGYYAGSMYPDNVGVFGYKSKVRVTKVASLDGTSSTIMFGEHAGGPQAGVGQLGLAWTAGFDYSGFGTPTVGQAYNASNNNWGLFSSQHLGGVNFCFVDGSVRKIAPDIDQMAWFYLSGYKDGVLVSLDP